MSRRRGGTQPSPLTTDDVVQAALRVVERSSLDALTVRAVAAELGVSAPAVHYHLRGDDLYDRVAEAVAAGVRIEIDPAASWVEQYVGLVRSMDKAFLRYPGAGTRALRASRPSAAARSLTETALGILSRAGVTDAEAQRLFGVTYLVFTGWLVTRGLADEGETHPALAPLATRFGSDDDEALADAIRRVLATAEPTDERRTR